MEETKETAKSFNIFFLGDSGVGKTVFIRRYVDSSSEFDPAFLSTIGTNAENVIVNREDGSKIKVKLTDTAGQERYRSIVKSMYQNADAIFLLYDITNEKSFFNISLWLDSIKEKRDEKELVIALVGNKCDLKDLRQVQTAEGEKKAEALKVIFMETSVKTRHNMEKIINQVVDLLIEKQKEKKSSFPIIPTPIKVEDKKCCGK